ncbi:hypothetical protein [Amycolatopsis speibonae]|uniref:Uncharacterized protein n=1 Tax=Amycolatopsis speibonae TaxID=1450224 RepID=A0ABV7P4M1_9PSEU
MGVLKLVRSWPARIPAGRSYVVDQVERIVIKNHDYHALRGLGDVLLLEWDIAVSKEDLERFAAVAAEGSSDVLVAPYTLYVPDPVWAHRSWPGGITPEGAAPVETGAAFCNLFGLGMTYLPGELVEGFCESGWASHFGDVEFSLWHYHNVKKQVPIAWDVRPVHLNHPGVHRVG